MVQIANEMGIPVITLNGIQKSEDFIKCAIIIMNQKYDYDYIPMYNVSVSLDFNRRSLSAFINSLEQMHLFKINECYFNDVEKCFVLYFKLSKDTGHITCCCVVGNNNYGILSFDFDLDQTMIPDLVESLKELF